MAGRSKTKYPDNNPKSQYGVKKPSLARVPAAGLLHTAHAMQNGTEKYGPYNWRENAVSATIYVDAAMRHLLSWYHGEDIDPESGANHLGHAMACFAILLDAQDSGKLIDDRPLPAPVGDMIRTFAQKGNFKKDDK